MPPIKSNAQRKWLWKNKPELAEKWEKETPNKKLPDKVEKPLKKSTIKKVKTI
jgi:hypothetical protein